MRWVRRSSASADRSIGAVVDPRLGDEHDPDDRDERADDQQHFIPAALVGEQHGGERPEHDSDRTVFACTGARSPSCVAVLISTFGVSVLVECGAMREQVEATIEVIRPALQADGGDIVLREVHEDTGVVAVELAGACVGCPASTQTLKVGIERIMRDRVDGVSEVVNVAEAAA